MFDVKLFPQFQAPAAATLADRSILRELTAVRDALGASYVNFSMFDHATDNPSIQHFLTYPMCWITEYLRNYYTQTDPFNRIDFRGNPIIDWHEIYSSDGERELLRRFSDAGLGDSGISVAARSGPRQCGVLSATFRTAVNRWPDIRRRSLPVLCEASDSLTRLHARLFAHRKETPVRLTARETEVLRLVAIGQTDEAIARTVGIARWTVVNHLRKAREKLGTGNRAAAVAQAMRRGLLEGGRDAPPQDGARPECSAIARRSS